MIAPQKSGFKEVLNFQCDFVKVYISCHVIALETFRALCPTKGPFATEDEKVLSRLR